MTTTCYSWWVSLSLFPLLLLLPPLLLLVLNCYYKYYHYYHQTEYSFVVVHAAAAAAAVASRLLVVTEENCADVFLKIDSVPFDVLFLPLIDSSISLHETRRV